MKVRKSLLSEITLLVVPKELMDRVNEIYGTTPEQFPYVVASLLELACTDAAWIQRVKKALKEGR